MTGVHSFDKTMQKTLEWLHVVQSKLEWDDEQKVYLATKAVLQTLRDRLPVQEAIHLGSQFPILMRGFYYEGYHPSWKPETFRQSEEFFRRVEEKLPFIADGEVITIAVLSLLKEKVDEGEIKDLISNLPKNLKKLLSESEE